MIRPVVDRLPLVVFLTMGLVAVAARSMPLTYMIDQLQAAGQLTERTMLGPGGLPVSLRVGASLVYLMLERMLSLLGELAMIAPDSQPWFLPPPDDWPKKWLTETAYDGLFVPLAASFAAKMLLLTPIYLAARRMHGAPWRQAAHIGLVLITLAGWPPIMVSLLFMAARGLVDWPIGYYNFGHELLPADFAAIGFVYLLLINFAQPAGLRLWRVMLLAALGQVFFENLGFVTGCAAALTAVGSLESRRVRTAWRVFVAAGLASAPAMVALLAFRLWQSSDTSGGGIDGYFNDKWLTVARQNFLWIKVAGAHAISLSVFPIAFGALLGLTARGKGGGDWGGWQVSAIAVASGAFVSICLGSLVSGFFPDLGRQIAFFLCLLPSVAIIMVAARR
jgi:hypothetical protein